MNFARAVDPPARWPWAVGGGLLLLLGVSAVFGLPALKRQQLRAQQSECPERLKAFRRMFGDDYVRHDLQFSEEALRVATQAYKPERLGRYLYRFAPEGPLATSTQPSGDEVGYAADEKLAKLSNEALEEGIPPELREQTGVQGYPNRICNTQGHCARQAVTVVCAGNLDDDSTVDVWSLSTLERTVWGGADIPAHVPFHHVDDLSPNSGPLPRVQAGQPMAAVVEPVAAAPSESDVERGPGDWTSYSADGQWRLKQRSNGNSCELQCTAGDGSQVWQRTGACVATQSERRFVGPKCERTVVLVPSPDRAQHQWAITPVVRSYTRGVLAKVQTGASLLPERQFRASPSWLQGCYGVPGEEPRYGRDGQSVEFTVINGQAVRIALVGGPDDTLDVRADSEAAVLAAPPAKKKKRSKSPTRR